MGFDVVKVSVWLILYSEKSLKGQTVVTNGCSVFLDFWSTSDSGSAHTLVINTDLFANKPLEENTVKIAAFCGGERLMVNF